MINTSFPLVKQLLGFNKHYNSLTNLRELITIGINNYKLVNGLLFYREYLVVPNVNNLCTNLIREAYE